MKMIEEGMSDIANKSCIKFRPREKDEHAVIIQVWHFNHLFLLYLQHNVVMPF